MFFLASTILVTCLIVGMIAVVSNPSPFFAAWGLVLMSGAGCALLVIHGGVMVALILFLIYLGGMLVVFAFSFALAADPYLKTWGNVRVALTSLIYMAGYYVVWGWLEKVVEVGSWWSVEEGSSESRGGESGALSFLYAAAAFMLLLGAFVLFLTLFVVFELVRVLGSVTIRRV